MIFILFGKPLVFWLGLLALLSFSTQIYLGIKMTHGHPEILKYHRLNAFILCFIVIVHLTLGLLLYL
jgi:hypothetical protein